MLFEEKRVCLYEPCRKCGGKLFRYLRKGTYDSEEYGTTHGLQVWDRCEECQDVFAATHVALYTTALEGQLVSLFTFWEQRRLADAVFAQSIQTAFRDAGGWAVSPERGAG